MATTTKAVLKFYEQAPDEVKGYFSHLPTIIEKVSWEVAISYLFSRVELAQNNTIYCVIVKIHQVDSTLAHHAVDAEHMTRERFRNLFEVVVGKKIPHDMTATIKLAETVRDKILHGKPVSQEAMKNAVINVIKYAAGFNELVSNNAKLKPFGSLQGFNGAGKTLPASTSRWILRGMGFSF